MNSVVAFRTNLTKRIRYIDLKPLEKYGFRCSEMHFSPQSPPFTAVETDCTEANVMCEWV